MKTLLYSEHWNGFWSLPPECVKDLQKRFPEIEFYHARTEQQIIETIQDAEVYFGYRLRKSDVDHAHQLKWVHAPAASVHPLSQIGLQEKGVVVTNSKGLHAVPISEHVIGCMLVFSRKFQESWKYQQNRHYAAREILTQPPLPGELRGKTVVILGLGSIGKKIAHLCKAFGMRVLATKQDLNETNASVDEIMSGSDFRKLLPQADYLIIALPLTAETDRLIGENELRLLKPSCVLINIARGTIVDESSLIHALKENWIRGAALDVFEKEPLPSDSELFVLPNVFLTPHTSGVTGEEHWPRIMEIFAENLRRYTSGEELLNVVDLNAGY